MNTRRFVAVAFLATMPAFAPGIHADAAVTAEVSERPSLSNEAVLAGAVTNTPLLLLGDSDVCECIDMVFVLDVTGSMAGAINNLKDPVAGLPFVIDQALVLSDNDLRVGLVTFSDVINVLHPWTTDTASVKTTIAGLGTGGGNGQPEASDEALREVLDSTICERNGPDFNEASTFRPECVKHAMLVTDNLPAGCDDQFQPGVDDVNANLRAEEAAALGVIISAIYVSSAPDPTVVAIMENYAEKTNGLFEIVPSNGDGTGEALQEALDICDDCNSNGVPDVLDIAEGTSADCDGNRVPDECEPDCNSNGVPDPCEIVSGTSADCNGDGVLDECEVLEIDCNSNGIADSCDAAMDAVIVQPSNRFTIWQSDPDTSTAADNFILGDPAIVSEVHLWGVYDNNDTGLADDFTVIFHQAAGAVPGAVITAQTGVFSTRESTGAQVFGLNEWYFELRLQPAVALPAGTYFVEVLNNPVGTFNSFYWVTGDLDADDGLPGMAYDSSAPGDVWFEAGDELAFRIITRLGASVDCDSNGIPDECDPDCNENGVADACDVGAGTSSDCNGTDVPDECESDCNCNNIQDAVDIAGNTSNDCNLNESPDECDVETALAVLQPANQFFIWHADPDGQTVADNFVLAEAAAITEVHLWGAYDGNDPGLADQFTVIFHTTNGAVPGASVATRTDVHSVRTATGAQVFALDVWLFELRLAPAVALPAGSYFVEILNDPLGTFNSFYWVTGNRDFFNGLPGMAYDPSAPGDNWFGTNDELAFRLVIRVGESVDCDSNGVPDECEPDCNNNGIVDACDIQGGTSEDCGGNGVADECESDCNCNNVDDVIDIIGGTSDDCNFNQIPDECDLALGVAVSQAPDRESIWTADADSGSAADDFKLTETALLHGVRLFGIYDGNNASTADHFTVVIHQDNNMLPGPQAATQNDVAATRLLTGENVFGLQEWEFVLRFEPAISLGAGIYWIEIFNDPAGTFDTFYWETGFTDFFNGRPGMAGASASPGVNWFNTSDDLAFEIILRLGEGVDADGDGLPDDCSGPCACLGDVNSDGLVNGADIQCFTNCAITGQTPGCSCSCADMDADGVIDGDDSARFVSRLLCGPADCSAPFDDCNTNGLPDTCEIADGFTPDLNGNGVPDECEGCSCPGDVNDDAFVDANDVACFVSCLLDQNAPGCNCLCGDLNEDGFVNGLDIQLFVNRVLQMAGECSMLLVQDCNANDEPDYLDFALSLDNDCNENQTLDGCDIQAGTAADCNENGVPDSCDIAGGVALDWDGNGVPDECQVCVCYGDVKPNYAIGIADLGALAYCIDHPDTPDYNCACGDMDGDGDVDRIDYDLLKISLTCGYFECNVEIDDCNSNHVDDQCEIEQGFAQDKNRNGIPDDCECMCFGDVKTSDSVDNSDLGALEMCIADPDLTEYACNCGDMNGDGMLDSRDYELLELRLECALNKCDSVVVDCNMNNVGDRCEIKHGYATDTNGNGIPDECE